MTVPDDSNRDQQAVQALAALQKAEKDGKATAVSIARDIKCSLFFQENWDVLLCAAPYAIEILGGLNAVSATKFAEEVKIAQPQDGFRYLTNQKEGMSYLQGALGDLSNKAHATFSIARSEMFAIDSESGAVISSIRELIKALGDLEAPMDEVDLQLQTVSEGAEKCKNYAGKIHDSATDFKNMAAELYVACRTQSAKVEDQRQQALITKELAEKEKEYLAKREEDTKAEMEEMKTRLENAHDMYKDALDKMPTGMDLVGQQVLLGLADTAGKCLEIYVASKNPAGAGTGLLKEFTEIKKDNNTQAKAIKKTASPAAGEPKQQETPETSILSKLTAQFPRRARQSKESQGEAPKADTSNNSSTGKLAKTSFGNWDLSGTFDATDPALKVASGVKTAIESIKSVIVGSPGGVTWEAVKPPKESKDGTVSSIILYSHTLTRLAKDFRPKKGGLASQLVEAVVKEGEQLCTELDEELKKTKTLGTSELPDKTSEVYKDWDARISRLALIATTLDQAAKSQPGSVPSAGTSLFTSPGDSAASIEQKANIAEQTVRLATAKLSSTQAVYQTTLKTYTDATKETARVQERLSVSIRQLESLHAKELSLDNIKKVLIRCIAFLEELKAQIDKLVQFFYRIAVFIRICIDHQVGPFEKRIKQYGDQGNKAAYYTRFARDIIFKSALTIMANFSLFQDIARMYTDVDTIAIVPGLELVGDVSRLRDSSGSSDDIFEQRKQKLKDYRLKAEQDVKDIVQTKQKSIIATLEARVKRLAGVLQQLPEIYLPAPQAKEALEGGAALAETSHNETIARAANESSVQLMVQETLEVGDLEEL
ncbi:hypothetical protein BDV25DRAFT_143115 [Aspergillus avenaceus]|uniref:Uncharacterized protein n=1 Tax=Aspergillus avenaceus TaxID=36643 RepID=A0A5N6TLA6_ASPAV|nr:hypothetical protein BDV25DRAFT_143115 [Aspergillus avenaceus]